MNEFIAANTSVEITVDFKTSRGKFQLTLFMLTLEVTSVLICHSFTPSPERILLAHFSNNQKRIGLENG